MVHVAFATAGRLAHNSLLSLLPRAAAGVSVALPLISTQKLLFVPVPTSASTTAWSVDQLQSSHQFRSLLSCNSSHSTLQSAPHLSAASTLHRHVHDYNQSQYMLGLCSLPTLHRSFATGRQPHGDKHNSALVQVVMGVVDVVRGLTFRLRNLFNVLLGRAASASQQHKGPGSAPMDWSSKLPRGNMFPRGTGMTGWALSGLIRTVVKRLSKQVAEVAAKQEVVYAGAVQRLRSSGRLKERLGGEVNIGQPLSQGMASVSINGVMTNKVSLVLPLTGAGGRTAQAHVSYVQLPREGESFDIRVQYTDGGMVQLEEGDHALGVNRTIDVDFKDVK